MIFEELKILKDHGKQFIPDVSKVELHQLFRGKPEISGDITEEEQTAIAALCPTMAITTNPVSIDLGKCMFCKECHFMLPDKIRFTNDYKIATNIREKLIITAGEQKPVELDATAIREEIKQYFGGALKLRQISAGGDNSTEMELNAAGNVNFDMGRFGIDFVASPRHADGIVITGAITENMAKPLQTCYNAIPSPKIIILAGTDAISGGVFAGSDAIKRDFLSKYSVDLYVPGNPVHPLTFVNGILSLIRKDAVSEKNSTDL